MLHHQAHHIVLNNGVAVLSIPFTNKLSEFIILLLKLIANLHKSSTKDGMFKTTNITKTCYIWAN